MPYDDDEDLFGEEFDFVDDDDEDEKAEAEDEDEKPAETTKPRRRTPAKDKPPAERPRGRAKPPAAGPPAARRNSRPPVQDEAARAPEPARSEEDSAPPYDDEPLDEEVARDEPAPEPTGPPADHVVHIYQFGKLKRTIPRKFTDEEAVGFAEEYTRTGKAYGRYAVATPEDEQPSETFTGASRWS
jgi:hypothetical protein